MIVVKRLVTKAFIIVAVFMLAACGATQKTTPVAPAQQTSQNSSPVKQSLQILPEQGLTPRQRLSKALRNLERGESDIAEVELTEYLIAMPGNQRAKSLLNQIKSAPEEFYPSEFFTLELRSGQSLSTLAKKYLGSALEFYALAKYNQIDKPSRVNIGSEIKIPLTSTAKRVLEEEKKAELAAQAELAAEVEAEVTQAISNEAEIEVQPESYSADELVSLINEANINNDYERSGQLLNQLLEITSLDDATKAIAITTYTGQAQALLASQPVEAAEVLVKLGQLQLDSLQDLAAFQSFKSANMADVNNPEALTALNSVKDKITQQYHREASVAFRQQELDEAIAKWDVVLEVDPNHSNAQAYRAQAIELRERLKALGN